MEKYRLACIGGLAVVGVMLAWPVLGWFFELLALALLAIVLMIQATIEWVATLPRYLILLATGGVFAAFLWQTRGR